MSQETTMERLLKIGFRRVGEWRLEGNAPRCKLSELATSKNILYAFVSRKQVLYLGKTVRTLKTRLSGYQNPGPTQSTSIEIHSNIQNHLLKGETVDIHALPDNVLLQYGEFQVNLAAGLEDSIIRDLKPIWNRRGK